MDDLGRTTISASGEPVEVEVGGMSRAELRAALQAHGIALNDHADVLFAHPVFDASVRDVVRVVRRTVAELGQTDGATLPQIFAAAQAQGLGLCPATTGPYLRLAWDSQAASANSVMSAGRSPDGALTVASPVLDDDVDFPKGFYLRVVDGRPWLRGYGCDDLYVFPAGAVFAFRDLPGKCR